MVATLRRAIWDFALYREAEPGTEKYGFALDAAGWIFWDGEEAVDEGGRLTFLHICMILDLDPKQWREGALSLTREHITKINRRIETEV